MAVVRSIVRLPAGSTVERVRQGVAFVVRRHEGLRSVFPIGAAGLPVQCVLAGFECVVGVAEVAGVPHHALVDTLEQAAAPMGDAAVVPTFRVVVGTVDGAPALALLSAHIVAVDGVALPIVGDELCEFVSRCAAGDRLVPPPAAWQPVDQAEYEASPRMRERSRRNLEKWRNFLAVSPPTALPFYWEDIMGHTRGVQSELISLPLGRACAVIARRCRVSESTVLLAGLALMMAVWSGQDQASLGETTASRYTPAMRTSVGRYPAVTRFVVCVSKDIGFDDLVKRTDMASTCARIRAICDEGELAMLMSRDSVSRGSRIEYAPQFNYHKYAANPLRTRDFLPAHAAASAESAIVDAEGTIIVAQPYIEAWSLADGGVRIRLRCSRQLLPSGGRIFLEQLERLIRTSADHPPAPVSHLAAAVALPRFWEAPEWISDRGSWFSLADTRRLLAEHYGVAAAQVFHDGDGQLSAFVAARDSRLTSHQLHDHMRDRASTWPTVILPRQYTICRRPPSAVADRQHWRAQEVLDTGSGRATPRSSPATPREQALLTAIAATDPDLEPDLSASYAELRGGFLRIPAIIVALANAGYRGITHQDLLGMATLGHLAGKLQPVGAVDELPGL